MKLNAVDLFCGAGGMSEALKEDFNVICSVEYDKQIAMTYSLNHSDEHLIVKDIRDISNEEFNSFTKNESNNIDLLVATPPCQGFSKHSRKKSFENNDPRNDLIMEISRVVDIFSPTFILFENVENIINYKIFLNFLKKVINLNDFGERVDVLRPSYHLRFESVNACDYGVPQKRKRLILIGKRINNFPFPEGTLKINNKNKPTINVPLNIWPEKQKAPTLGEYLKPFKLNKLSAGETDTEDHLHTARNLSSTNLKRIKLTPHNGGSRNSWSKELILDCHQKSNVSFGDVYGRMNYNDYSPTITCGGTSYSKGRFGHPVEDRAISLREAALIQTFPLNYKFTGTITGEPNKGSKDKIATQIGNAVPVNLARAFTNKIAQEIRKNKKSNSQNLYSLTT